jgi:hypothetical protein
MQSIVFRANFITNGERENALLLIKGEDTLCSSFKKRNTRISSPLANKDRGMGKFTKLYQVCTPRERVRKILNLEKVVCTHG